jgi:hypothetical protein
MMRFTRDHGKNKAGDEVESHPNEAYLLRVGVLEVVKEKAESNQVKEKKSKTSHTPKKKH